MEAAGHKMRKAQRPCSLSVAQRKVNFLRLCKINFVTARTIERA